ncbi:MAG: glycosyltransferase [Agathobacter sp.]|nr:glycosyltransferase [Agathobacter sp.]
MRVLHINICGNLSTGNIASDIIREVKLKGGDGILAYARNAVADDIPSILIGSQADVYAHAVLSRITDRTGFYSKKATLKLIEEIRAWNPDIIHLHNLHGYYLHVGVLFDFLKEYHRPVVWTLHDCWAFTGHCPYFSAVECERWKSGCHDCPEKKNYPASLLLDQSRRNYRDKQRYFLNVPDMTLVTPSKWLKGIVGESFLQGYPCEVVYNGIDQKKFYPRTGQTFREKYRLLDKRILLGVASTWSRRKGYEDFCKLAELLPDNWIIVMVGLKKEQIQMLPADIVGIERTKDVEELAQIYSESDLYFNASVEETFGLTTVEAIFCGTPAVVYNSTAVPECVQTDGEEATGYIVGRGDIAAVADIVRRLEDGSLPWLGRTKELDRNKEFFKEEACKKYYELYQTIMERKTK